MQLMILFGQNKKHSSENFIFFVCVCKNGCRNYKRKMGKMCIETLIYHNKEEKINELWHKMSDIEIQLGHSSIVDAVLKRITKCCSKKTKDITEEENKNKNHILKIKRVFLLLENLRVI